MHPGSAGRQFDQLKKIVNSSRLPKRNSMSSDVLPICPPVDCSSATDFTYPLRTSTSSASAYIGRKLPFHSGFRPTSREGWSPARRTCCQPGRPIQSCPAGSSIDPAISGPPSPKTACRRAEIAVMPPLKLPIVSSIFWTLMRQLVRQASRQRRGFGSIS